MFMTDRRHRGTVPGDDVRPHVGTLRSRGWNEVLRGWSLPPCLSERPHIDSRSWQV